MFEEAGHLADLLRSGLSYYLLLALPILIICSANPVLASSEFTVHRLAQFDVSGVAYGCRASVLSLEAKSLFSWSTNRHCIVAKLQDITIDQFDHIRQKAGGLVILMPKNIALMSPEEKAHLKMLEQAMLVQASSIPIYFCPYNEELERIVTDITLSSSEANAENNNKSSIDSYGIVELFNTISANGYQIIVSGSSHAASKNSKIPIFHGELMPPKYLMKHTEAGAGIEANNNKLPLIIITTHLNTFGLYNEYPLNADAAVLMTLVELFGKLYSTVSTAPKYRLMFLLTESGALLNFQGVKKWLDENVQLQNVDFVLCLDTITKTFNTEPSISLPPPPLYMHVSKPPKEGTAVNNFYKVLKEVGSQQYYNISIDGVHKKINLADTQLAWEHERFSMKRLPAFTLSALKTPKDSVRSTIFKDAEQQVSAQTLLTAKLIAEALARYIYNIDEGHTDIFTGTLSINKALIKCYLNLKSALQNNDLKNGFEKYLKNVKLIYDKPDIRDPDFMFYEGQEATLNVYRVKPAVFDLFLSILIAAYLCVVYLIIKYLPVLYAIMCRSHATATANGGHYERSGKGTKNH